ncbi:hypothetical protein EGW08_011138 [Elysia chlorotica]|uniref:Ubiquitin-like domain-containing protein n=1 Tax=Elysia chlorotica TaxID=188477 RepID=A0A3S1BHW5_ELYCH|nr:hypothetical protein EGW08_011138 [Elysia chlorotica]
MDALDLSTEPRSLPNGNGRQFLIPGKKTTLSGFDISFEIGIPGAESHVEINNLRNGQVHCCVHVSVGKNRLGASIRNIRNAAAGVVWIRVTERGSLPEMEVIQGHQAPSATGGFRTLGLIKIQDNARNQNDSDSDDEMIDFQIFVKLCSGKSTTYTVNSETLVESLKLKIQERHQMPPDQQRLLYAGHQLEDHRSLGSYNIEANASLNMVLRLRGG